MATGAPGGVGNSPKFGRGSESIKVVHRSAKPTLSSSILPAASFENQVTNCDSNALI